MVVTDNSWWSLTCTPLPGLEVRARLEDTLYAAGCGGIWDHAPENGNDVLFSENSETSLMTAYFPVAMQALLPLLGRQLEGQMLVSGLPQIQAVENEDWLDGWRKNFTLTELTEQTLIVPSWQELPEAETRLGIKIYPGQGFGTGTHETTRLAAIALEKKLDESEFGSASVLDVGTGSGILAILAAKRGAVRVLALDIDEEALINARENCAHNLACDQVSLESRPITEVEEEFNLIVANIIAPVLLQLAPEFSRLLKSGGRLILSGILVEQIPQVRKVYTDLGFLVKPMESIGEWAGFVCEKISA